MRAVACGEVSTRRGPLTPFFTFYKVYVTLQGGVHGYSHARTDKVLAGRLPAAKGEKRARAPPPYAGEHARCLRQAIWLRMFLALARTAAMEMC